MKQLFILVVRAYWLLIPATKRRRCIFNKSCSHYVYEKLITGGYKHGLAALVYRYKSCRPGYMCYINPISGKIEMVLSNGNIVSEVEIADKLKDPLR